MIYVVSRRMALAPIVVALLVSGCAKPPATVRVEVPVPVYCEPPDVPPAPALPIDSLSSSPTVFEVMRATFASIGLLEAHNRILRAVVDACRKPRAP